MKVQIIREKSFQGVTAQGPFTRIFAVGDIVELPEMHAQSLIIEGAAKVAPVKAEKADVKPAKPAARKK